MLAQTEAFEAFLEEIQERPFYRSQLEDIVDAMQDAEAFRNKVFTVKTLEEVNRIEALSLLVQSWPTSDIRLASCYSIGEAKSSDDLFMTDVAEGLMLVERKRSLKNSSVVFDIMLQSNIEEFEQYNMEVDQHNFDWMVDGCRTQDFDPYTGDISKILDTYVDYAKPTSMHHKQVKLDISRGSLAGKAPYMKHVVYGKLELRLTEEAGVFTLGFVVQSLNGGVLYYNELEGKDLSKLVRRAVQEIWGHPFIREDEGPFYEALSLLFKGKKTKICKERKNKLPVWCKGLSFKRPTGMTLSSPLAVITTIFSGWVPTLLFIYGLLWIPLKAMCLQDGTGLLTSMIITCVLIFVSLKIGDYLAKETQEKKLIDRIM